MTEPRGKTPASGSREDPRFFATRAAFRAWLKRNAASATELWLGFRSVRSGAPGLTRAEAIDEALCAGWIDGLGQRIDDDTNQARFSPRKAGSTWSAKNIARVAVLSAEGRMQPAGIAAFERRSGKKSGVYSYEQSEAPRLTATEERSFQAQPAAWAYLDQQPAGYRKKALWWVAGARQEATRARRLAALIAASAAGVRLPWTLSPGKTKPAA